MRRLLAPLLTLTLLAAAPPSARADDEAARIHYQAGEQHYLRGRYREAIDEFQEAYRLSNAAALLFNISQAYERLGDLRSARDYLAKYIESGKADPTEVDTLEDKLRVLDERIAAEDPVRPPTPTRKPPFRVVKWVVGGTGVALLVASTLFALDSRAQSDKLEDAQGPASEFTPELQDAETRGKRSELLAWITGVGGGALVVTGAVLFYLDLRAVRAGERPAPGRVTIVPVVAPDFAGAAAAWRF